MQADVVIIGGGPAGIITALTTRMVNPERSVCLVKQIGDGVIPCAIPYMINTLESPQQNAMGNAPLERAEVKIVVDPALAKRANSLGKNHDHSRDGWCPLANAIRRDGLRDGVPTHDCTVEPTPSRPCRAYRTWSTGSSTTPAFPTRPGEPSWAWGRWTRRGRARRKRRDELSLTRRGPARCQRPRGPSSAWRPAGPFGSPLPSSQL